MKRSLIVLVLSLATLAVRASSQQLPTNEEAWKWVATGSGRADIGRGWPKSYSFLAQVRYELDGKTSQGTFEIRWAAEDRFRLDLKLGEVLAAEMALADRYYFVRSKPNEANLPAIERFLIADLVFHPLKELIASGGKVSRVWLQTGVEGNQICVEMSGDERYAKEECFDAKTQKIVSARIQDMSKFASDPTATVLEETDFIDVGKLRYPKKMKMQFLAGNAQIEVEKFEETEEFDENTFVPPQGAVSREWCSKPQITMAEKPGMPAAQMGSTGKAIPEMVPPIFRGPRAEDHVFSNYRYILVGPDGAAEIATPLMSIVNGRPGRPVFLRGETYPVHSCNGKGIEYEMISLSAARGVPR